MELTDEQEKQLFIKRMAETAVKSKAADGLLMRKDVAEVGLRMKKMPRKGDRFELQGIVYEVRFVDYKRGRMQVEMYVPEKSY